MNKWQNHPYYKIDIEFEPHVDGPSLLSYERGSFYGKENNYWGRNENGDKIKLEWFPIGDKEEGYYIYKSDKKYGEYERLNKFYTKDSAILNKESTETYYKVVSVINGRESLFSYPIKVK